jgi:hypothetical protein
MVIHNLILEFFDQIEYTGIYRRITFFSPIIAAPIGIYRRITFFSPIIAAHNIPADHYQELHL